MAEEWTKFNLKLLDHPKVIAIARSINKTPLNWKSYFDERFKGDLPIELAICVTVTGLMRTWCHVNAHAKLSGDDAVLHHCTLQTIDLLGRITGLGAGMAAVGWAALEEDCSIRFPNFLTYNMPPELRKRVKERERKQRTRAGQTRDICAPKAGQKYTNREEKRREELIEIPNGISMAPPAIAVSPEVAKPVSPKKKKPPAERKPREPDPIWDELARVFFPSGVATSEESLMGRAVRDLKQKHATPEEIARRVARWPVRYPDASFPKIMGFVSNWDALREPEKPKSTYKPFAMEHLGL